MTYLIYEPHFAIEVEPKITWVCVFREITYLRIGEIRHFKTNDISGHMVPRDQV